MSGIVFSIVALEDIKQSTTMPSHPGRSLYNEIYFVTKGYLVREMNLHTIQVNRHELHLSLEEQIISIKDCSDDIAGFYCRFSNEFLEQLYLKDDVVKDLMYINSFMYRYPLRLTKGATKRLSNTFSALYSLSAASPSGSGHSLLASYLTTVLHELKPVLQSIEQSSLPSKPFHITKQYHDLLSAHIIGHRNIEFYANLLGISPNHLNKSVKKVTGETAIELRNRMTLLEAKFQLKESHASVSEIADKLGFCDLSCFSRFFKQATGLSPVQYRGASAK